jgi:uridine kinase
MKPYLIAIAGPSCAGKTELAKALAAALPATSFSLDAYYRDLSRFTLAERARFNFDEPAALDYDLLLAQVRDLAAGRPVDLPIYDFAAHSRTGRTERLVPPDFLIIEGLFALYWEEVRKLYGTAVFVEAPDEVCLQRRLVRDVRERGRTPESVLQQFTETVQPMAALHVRPTRAFADVVVSGLQPIAVSADAVLQHIRRTQAAARE